jgi:cytosine/adenosine deaminase-related metal-dependent hydrolase
LFCPESKQVPFEDITIPGDTDCRVRQIEIARVGRNGTHARVSPRANARARRACQMADIERGKTQDGCVVAGVDCLASAPRL